MGMPYPGDDWTNEAQSEVKALYQSVDRWDPNSNQASVFVGRMLYDIGNDTNGFGNYDAYKAKHLAELRAALGLNPNRDQLINIQGNFCNLIDSEGIPIFDAFIDELILHNLPKAEDWINVLKANHTTHINLELSGDYNENLGWISRYPIPGHDWTKDIKGFRQIIDWVISKGLIPILKLSMDGQGYDPNGWTYGWQWGMDNLPHILTSLGDYVGKATFSTGYDGCFPNWTADQTIKAIKMLRTILGPDAVIDTEFAGPGTVGYCHMGNGASDWSDDKLGMLDTFSIELMTNPPNSDGVQQTAARLLGPEAKNIESKNAGPYYLVNTSKRIGIWMYETVAYWAIRKQLGQDAIRQANASCAQYGFQLFGNGLP